MLKPIRGLSSDFLTSSPFIIARMRSYLCNSLLLSEGVVFVIAAFNSSIVILLCWRSAFREASLTISYISAET